MSTELSSLIGKIEIPRAELKDSVYLERTIFLTRFHGGQKRGASLQITFSDETGNTAHIQLDNENVFKLIEILKEAFD